MTAPVFVNCRFLTQRLTGVQRFAVEICRHIRRLDSSVEFLAPRDALHADTDRNFDLKIVGKSTGHLWEQFDLPRFLKKHGCPILLNLCNLAPAYYPRNVVTIHDLALFHNPSWFSLTYRTYPRWVISRTVRKAIKVLTVSSFSKQEIKKFLSVPENCMTVIPNAVSENIFRLAGGSFDNEYGRYVLAVCSIDPRKNISRLIQAFSQLKLKDTKLILVGARNRIFAKSGLPQASQHECNIICKEYLPEAKLVALYQHALCLVYPSLYEGFGLPPLEAMACGCAVVTSNVSSLPETCGNAAFYVNPNDVNSIAEGIYKVTTNDLLRKDLIEKGLKRAALFNWKSSAQQLLNAVGSL